MRTNQRTAKMRTAPQVSCLVALLTLGCQPSAGIGDTPTGEVDSTSLDEFNPWTCPADPGIAPSGSLEAKLVAGSEATDTLPRLDEGPVWIEGAVLQRLRAAGPVRHAGGRQWQQRARG